MWHHHLHQQQQQQQQHPNQTGKAIKDFFLNFAEGTSLSVLNFQIRII